MTRPVNRHKKAKKLIKGDEVFVMGKFCRITNVHTHDNDTIVHVRTYTSTDPRRFTVIIGSDVRVQYRPKFKKN